MADFSREQIAVLAASGPVALDGCDISGLDLSGLSLRKASFIGANCKGTNFSRADLSGANFADADITQANFSSIRDGRETHKLPRSVTMLARGWADAVYDDEVAKEQQRRREMAERDTPQGRERTRQALQKLVDAAPKMNTWTKSTGNPSRIAW